MAADEPAPAAAERPDAAPVHADTEELKRKASERARDEAPRGWVEGDGSQECPEGYPVKGNSRSRIFHLPGESSYAVTRAEICFATAEEASAQGYRPRRH